jgi:hypothetical protein
VARSLKDALVDAGVVSPQDTPEARRAREQRERRAREEAEIAARMDEPPSRLAWEAPPSGRIVEGEEPSSPAAEAICADCGEPFEPDSSEHRPYGTAEQCGPCARGEEPGPRRKRGQMVWTHKTAPTLEIEGGPALSPEELAAMRRR